MRVRRYNDADAEAWDRIVADAPMGTFLHTRRFLSYHGGRFRDVSLFLEDDRGRAVGVLPAAMDPASDSVACSHPGSTFGGLVHGELVSANDAGAMLQAVMQHYREHGVAEMVYKCIPAHLTDKPSCLDQYALWRAGGRLVRRDLWNVIDVTQPRKSMKAQMRRRRMRKALDAGLAAQQEYSDDAYRQFHAILSSNLEARHHVRPVHTADEMILLRGLFPDQVRLWLVRDVRGEPLAGTWVFRHSGRAWHTQYIAATQAGRDVSATDQLFETIIEQARLSSIRYLSLGASTEQDGRVLNMGLFDFKASFGYGSVVQDFFRLDLEVGHVRS